MRQLTIHLLASFFGSGTVNVLAYLLEHRPTCDTLLAVNERSAIGVDLDFLADNEEQRMLELSKECICCKVRSYIARRSAQMLRLRANYAKRPRRRGLIEATGMANPAPIRSMVLRDPMLACQVRCYEALATIDSVHVKTRLAAHGEAVKQLAVADCLVLPKRMLVEQSAGLNARVAQRHSLAPRLAVLNRLLGTSRAPNRSMPYGSGHFAESVP